MTFDEWMRTHEPKHCDSDDSISLRLLRKCWNAATQAERERCAKVCEALFMTEADAAANKEPMPRYHDAIECAAAIREMKD